MMGTVVTMEVVPSGADQAVERAFGWFREIERICSRFNPDSELMQLTAKAGTAMPASAILFEAVRFALRVAEATGGAFDPTVGRAMEVRGFNREYRTGAAIHSAAADDTATWQDVELDEERRTIRLRRPLLLDLGAVAKGLAIDAAARELRPFTDFAVYAGGDVFLGGANPSGKPWRVGIRHPRVEGEIIDALMVSNQAMCTSGDYERPGHILDPRQGDEARPVASATVVAPTAMLADALATAAFVLGPEAGIELLTKMGVEGFIVTPGLERFETGGLRRAA
jgi:thiamine biosynthesis lipoprotein